MIELLARDDEAAVAGGTRRNRAHAEDFTTFAVTVPEERIWLVCDAMTSGGLLAAAGSGTMPRGIPGAVIGRLVDGEPGAISVV